MLHHTGQSRRFLTTALFLFCAVWRHEAPVLAESGNEQTTADPHPPLQSQPLRLDEVTVTAQRREESAQDVPISMRVFSADELQDRDARRTTDLIEATPNMNFTSVESGVAGANVFMRGVGAIVVQNVEPGVGFYVDDVFVGTSHAFNIDLLDVDRAEILRGPQGTLYGRNALGGAIHLLSTPPDETRAFFLDTEFGNYDFRKVRASANVPLVKGTLLSRFALTYTERNGTVLNLFDGHHINDLGNLGGRVQFRILPAENVEIDLNGDYSHDAVMRSAFGPFEDIVHQRTRLADPADEHRDVYGTMGKVVLHHPNFTLITITGFRGVTDDTQADFTPLYPVQQGIKTQQQQVSQELRLLSPDGSRLQWVGCFTIMSGPGICFSLRCPTGHQAGCLQGIGKHLMERWRPTVTPHLPISPIHSWINLRSPQAFALPMMRRIWTIAMSTRLALQEYLRQHRRQSGPPRTTTGRRALLQPTGGPISS